MKNILLAVFLAFLTACATKPPAVYGDGKPLVVYHGTIYWVGSPTEEVKKQQMIYHFEPSRDEKEVKALRAHAVGASLDSASTIVTLAVCAGSKELNPIIALVPGGWLVIPASWLAHKHLERVADKTSRYYSAGEGVYTIAGIRTMAGVWNTLNFVNCL